MEIWDGRNYNETLLLNKNFPHFPFIHSIFLKQQSVYFMQIERILAQKCPTMIVGCICIKVLFSCTAVIMPDEVIQERPQRIVLIFQLHIHLVLPQPRPCKS